VGILVAFASIGAIFWYSYSQNPKEFDLSLIESLPASPSPTTTPNALNGYPPPVQPRPQIISSPLSSSAPPTESPLPASKAQSPTVKGTAPVQTRVVKFVDVPQSFWAGPFIEVMAQRGIIQGFSDNTFRPAQPVTRAEFAAMLQRAFERPRQEQPLQFRDVSSREEAAQIAIEQAVRMGFMKGYPDQLFRPDRPIPKVESLVALTSGLQLTPAPAAEQTISFYQDAGQIPSYAVDEVATATQAGLVVNYPEVKILGPQNVVNRAEATVLIYQALVKAGQAPRIASPYIVQP
jgi:hypothetical protein